MSIKLVLTLAGLVLALSILLPELNAAVHAANTLHNSTPGAGDRSGLARATAAASTVLITTVLLAVFKPFGRIRRRVSTDKEVKPT